MDWFKKKVGRDRAEPLLFAAMPNYPYGSEQRDPNDALLRDYLRRYLTRQVQANPSPRRQ